MTVTKEISMIRDAVLAMEADRALLLLENMKKKFKKDRIKAEDLVKLQTDLDGVCDLARSTCEGINSARQQIDRIISESGRVEVYSESGEKISQEVGVKVAWKY